MTEQEREEMRALLQDAVQVAIGPLDAKIDRLEAKVDAKLDRVIARADDILTGLAANSQVDFPLASFIQVDISRS